MVYYILEAGKRLNYTELFVWDGLVWFVGNPDFTEPTDDNSDDSSNGDNSQTDGGTAQPDGGTAQPDGGTAQPDGGTAQPDGGTAQPDGGTAQPDGGTAQPDGGTGQSNSNGSNGNDTPSDSSTQTSSDNDNRVKFNRPPNSIVNGIPTDSEGKYDFSSYYPDLKKIDKKNMATYGGIAINPEKPENRSLLYGVDNDYDGRPKKFKK